MPMARDDDFDISADGENLEEMEQFNFEDLDTFDGDNPGENANMGKGRNPVTHTLKGTYNAALEEIRSRTARDHAIGVMNAAISTDAQSAFGDIQSAYESGVDELKKSLKPLTGGVNKLVKDIRQLGPKGGMVDNILGKINGLLEGDKENQPNHEEIAAATADTVIAEMNSQYQALEDKLGGVLRAVDEQKQASLTTFLQQSVAVSSIIKEQNKIYYNKSLGLQWRMATGIEEGLRLSRAQFETYTKQLENIIHNTQLPEAVKITNMELAGQRLKQIGFDTMSETLFKQIAPLEKVKGNVLRRLREKIEDYQSTVDTANDLTEGVSGMMEAIRDSGMGPEVLVGSQIGGMILNKLYDVGGKLVPEKIRKKLNHSIIAGANAPIDYLKSLKTNNPEGLIGKLRNKAIDLAVDYGDDKESKNNIKLSAKALNQPAIFDGRTHNTVNVIIPRLLSKIHNELQAARTGVYDPDNELRYDIGKMDFRTAGEITKSIRRETVSTITKIGQYQANNIAKHVASVLSGVETPNKKKILDQLGKAILAEIARTGKLSPEAMTNAEFLAWYPPELQLEAASLFEEFLTELKQGNNTASTYRMFANANSMIQYSPAMLEKYATGMNQDLIAKTGLIDVNEFNGEQTVSSEGIAKILSHKHKRRRYATDRKLDRHYETGDIEFWDDLKRDAQAYSRWATSENRYDNRDDIYHRGGTYTDQYGTTVTRLASLTDEEKEANERAVKKQQALEEYLNSPEMRNLAASKDEKDHETYLRNIEKKKRELDVEYDDQGLLHNIKNKFAPVLKTMKGINKTISGISIEDYKRFKAEHPNATLAAYATGKVNDVEEFQEARRLIEQARNHEAMQTTMRYGGQAYDYVKSKAQKATDYIKRTDTYQVAMKKMEDNIAIISRDPRIQKLNSTLKSKYLIAAEYATDGLNRVQANAKVQQIMAMDPQQLEKEFKNVFNQSKDKVATYKSLVDHALSGDPEKIRALKDELHKDLTTIKSVSTTGMNKAVDLADRTKELSLEYWNTNGSAQFENIKNQVTDNASDLTAALEEWEAKAKENNPTEEPEDLLGKISNVAKATIGRVYGASKDVKSAIEAELAKPSEQDIRLDTIATAMKGDGTKQENLYLRERLRRENIEAYRNATTQEERDKIVGTLKATTGLDINFDHRGMSDKKFNRLDLEVKRIEADRMAQAMEADQKLKELREQEELNRVMVEVVAEVAAGADPLEAVKKREGLFSKAGRKLKGVKQALLGKFDKAIGYEKSPEEIEADAKTDNLVEMLSAVQGTKEETRAQQELILKELIDKMEAETEEKRSAIKTDTGLDATTLNQNISNNIAKEDGRPSSAASKDPNDWRNAKRMKFIGQFDPIHRLLNDKSIRNPIGMAMFLAGESLKMSTMGAAYGAKYTMWKIPKAIWTSKTATSLRAWERKKYKEGLISLRQGIKNAGKNLFYIPQMLQGMGKIIAGSSNIANGVWNSPVAQQAREAERGWFASLKDNSKDSWLGKLLAFIHKENAETRLHDAALAASNNDFENNRTNVRNSMFQTFSNFIAGHFRKELELQEEAAAKKKAEENEENNQRTWKDKIKESWEKTKEKWSERGRKIKGYFTGPVGPNGERETMFDKVKRIGFDTLKIGAAGAIIRILMDKNARESFMAGVKGFASGVKIVYDGISWVCGKIIDLVKFVTPAFKWVGEQIKSIYNWFGGKTENDAPQVDEQGNPIPADHTTAEEVGKTIGVVAGTGAVARVAGVPAAKLAGKAVVKTGVYGYRAAKGAVELGGKALQAGANAAKSPAVTQAAEAAGKVMDKKGIISKIKEVFKTLKQAAIKKLGPKAGLILGKRIAAKIAATLVPFAGVATLAYYAYQVGKMLYEGYELKSAISIAVLGFDVFDANSVALDEDGNPIQPDENINVNSTDEELEKIANTDAGTTSEDKAKINKSTRTLQQEGANQETINKNMNDMQNALNKRNTAKNNLRDLNLKFVKAFNSLPEAERSVKLTTKNRGKFVEYGQYKNNVYWLGEPTDDIVWDPTKSQLAIGRYVYGKDRMFSSKDTIEYLKINDYIQEVKKLQEDKVDLGLPENTPHTFEDLYKALIEYKINKIKSEIIYKAENFGKDEKFYEDEMERRKEEAERKAKDDNGPFQPANNDDYDPNLGNRRIAKTPGSDAADRINQRQSNINNSVGTGGPSGGGSGEIMRGYMVNTDARNSAQNYIQAKADKPMVIDTKFKKELVQELAKAMESLGMNEQERAAFLATIETETGKLRTLEENTSYSTVGRIREIFGKHFSGMSDSQIQQYYVKNPVALASRVYGGRMGNGDESTGEGYKYRGRGLIQLTGKDNYTKFANETGIDAVNHPELISQDPKAAVQSMAWYWKTRKGLSNAAKQGNVNAVRELVNGGHNGMQEFRQSYANYLNGTGSLSPALEEAKRNLDGGTDTGTDPTGGNTQVASSGTDNSSTPSATSTTVASATPGGVSTAGTSASVEPSAPVSNGGGSVAPVAPTPSTSEAVATTQPESTPTISMTGVETAIDKSNATQTAQLSEQQRLNLLMEQVVELLKTQSAPPSTRIQDQPKTDQNIKVADNSKPGANQMNNQKPPRGNVSNSGYQLARSAG